MDFRFSHLRLDCHIIAERGHLSAATLPESRRDSGSSLGRSLSRSLGIEET